MRLTHPERFIAWRLVRVRSLPPEWPGSIWRRVARMYRDRALNLMMALRNEQRNVRTMQEAYDEVERRAEQAEADVAALRAALEQAARMFTIKGARKIAEQTLATDHPGAALLAKLAAARKLAAAVRYELADGFGVDTLGPALDDYDAAAKARTE